LRIAKHLRQHDIRYELFEATYGYEGEAFEHYRRYCNRELGDLKRYAHYAERERRRGMPFIDSAGAMGYIYTYLRILRDVKEKGYERFLIFEDDVMLHRNFETMFETFMQRIDPDWRIIQLGATQTGWRNIDLTSAEKNHFYFPTYDNDQNSTYGSFAMGLDHRIVDELIEAQSAFEAAFDYLPMEEMYEKYKGKCFIAYPNLVIPDVRTSTIRNEMDQEVVAFKLKWDLSRFDFPLDKPSLTVVLRRKEHFRQVRNLSASLYEHIDVSFVYPASDGLRPFHADTPANDDTVKISTFDEKDSFILPTLSDYAVTLPQKEKLEEEDIVRYVEFELALRSSYEGKLKKIELPSPTVEKGLLSLVVPVIDDSTYDDIKENIESLSIADTVPKELIFVGNTSNDAETIDKLIATLKRKYPEIPFRR
jgi:hypothetical protein